MASSDGKTYTVEGTKEGGFLGDLVPDVVAGLSARAIGTRAEVEDEIDYISRALRVLWQMEPDESMRMCAGLSARLTELYIHLHRAETKDRSYRQIRTQQVVPLLNEIDRQHKLASRIVEIRRQDISLER